MEGWYTSVVLPKMYTELQRTPVRPGEPEPRTHYQPSKAYHPTYKLVKCSSCATLGFAYFPGGFNLQAGDRLMNGKPIGGRCEVCGRSGELVPVPVPKGSEEQVGIHARIEAELQARLDRGIPIPESGVLTPLARIDEHERAREQHPELFGPDGERLVGPGGFPPAPDDPD